MSDGTGTAPHEPPTTLITAGEPPTTPMTAASLESGQDQSVRAGVAVDDEAPATGEAPAAAAAERSGPVWPGLTAAGLPTRVPRAGDEEDLKEAFAQSWEASPTSPTPLTRQPFVPTFTSPTALSRSWTSTLDPTAPAAAEPPEPREPPAPAEPPDPRQPPAPPSPPAPPGPPVPTPFPAPAPVPAPPGPVPAPTPPSPVPVPPPAPPVPTPPSPFPAPPGPVPPPPAIVPGLAARATEPGLAARATEPGLAARATEPGLAAPLTGTAATMRSTTLYPSGTYPELRTEPITGIASQGRGSEVSGTLAGHLLTRSGEMYRRRERRRKLRTALWVTGTLLVFALGIVVVVDLLAGDFIRSVFDTFSGWAN